jgi:hypothetical protein
MLDLSLISPDAPSPTAKKLTSSVLANDASGLVIARSRRPAILSYASPIMDKVNILSGLMWFLVGWKKESETLEVSMFEGVEFGKGWKNVPQGARVVIEADEKMQIYEVKIKIIAKLGGLRSVRPLPQSHFLKSKLRKVIIAGSCITIASFPSYCSPPYSGPAPWSQRSPPGSRCSRTFPPRPRNQNAPCPSLNPLAPPSKPSLRTGRSSTPFLPKTYPTRPSPFPLWAVKRPCIFQAGWKPE